MFKIFLLEVINVTVRRLICDAKFLAAFFNVIYKSRFSTSIIRDILTERVRQATDLYLL